MAEPPFTFHQSQQGKYVCDECGYGNWGHAAIQRHVATVHHPCQWCGARFTGVRQHEWRCPKRPMVTIVCEPFWPPRTRSRSDLPR